MTMSPVRNWERIAASHPDHMAAGEATVQAIYPDARNQFAHPTLMTDEGLEEWHVKELWMSGSPTPNTYVDVTDKFELKLAALRAHVSQTEHMEDLEGMIRGWMTQTAAARRAARGSPGGDVPRRHPRLSPGRGFRPVRRVDLPWAMSFVFESLVVLHFIGLAALLGGWLVQMSAPTKVVNRAMLDGAFTQLATGLAMVGLAETVLADDEDINHMKVGIKLADPAGDHGPGVGQPQEGVRAGRACGAPSAA